MWVGGRKKKEGERLDEKPKSNSSLAVRALRVAVQFKLLSRLALFLKTHFRSLKIRKLLFFLLPFQRPCGTKEVSSSTVESFQKRNKIPPTTEGANLKIRVSGTGIRYRYLTSRHTITHGPAMRCAPALQETRHGVIFIGKGQARIYGHMTGKHRFFVSNPNPT